MSVTTLPAQAPVVENTTTKAADPGLDKTPYYDRAFTLRDSTVCHVYTYLVIRMAPKDEKRRHRTAGHVIPGFDSVARIADSTGGRDPRTINGALEQLMRMGIIQVRGKYGPRGWRITDIELIPPGTVRRYAWATYRWDRAYSDPKIPGYTAAYLLQLLNASIIDGDTFRVLRECCLVEPEPGRYQPGMRFRGKSGQVYRLHEQDLLDGDGLWELRKVDSGKACDYVTDDDLDLNLENGTLVPVDDSVDG